MKGKLQVLFTLYPLVVDSAINPWGDFNQILALSTRVVNENDLVPAHSTLYFKVCKVTGGLQPITTEEFKDACVAAATAQAINHQVKLD